MVTTTGDDRTASTVPPAGQLAATTIAVQRASRLLLARQDSQGWWSGRPEGEISLDAEGLLVREFLGIATPELTKAVAQQVRSLQRTDGSWAGTGEPGRTGSPATAGGGASPATADGRATPAAGRAGRTDLADVGEPGYASDLSASVLAYLALRLAGDSPDAYHMAVAAGWIRDAGGLAAAASSARAWLACFGLAEWEDVPVPLPEVIYLPPRRSAGLGAWAGWSRLALISLAVTGAVRPVRQLPFNLSALRVAGPPGAEHPDDWRLRACRRGLRVPPMNLARSAAVRKCGHWLAGWLGREAGQGSTGPVWPMSLVALHLAGYPLDHPVMADGLAWLDSIAPQLRSAAPKPNQASPRRPPVRDTTLAIAALAAAGLAGEHAALAAAGHWLLDQRISKLTNPPEPQPGPAPSGWSFRHDGYPDIADTGRVLAALSNIRMPGLDGHPAISAALRWLASLQGRDGGWGGSAAVTALVIQALSVQPPSVRPLPEHPLAAPGPAGSRAVRRGVVFLLRGQRADGSWPGGPGESDLYATTTVLPALLAAGVLPCKPVITGAAHWLLSRQNLDAGWPSGPEHAARDGGRAQSDAPGTARALTALVTARNPDLADPVDLAADWLVRAQQADGGWSERPAGRSAPRNRGNIVPGLLLPLGALGRYVRGGGSWAERPLAADPISFERIPGPGARPVVGRLAVADD